MWRATKSGAWGDAYLRFRCIPNYLLRVLPIPDDPTVFPISYMGRMQNIPAGEGRQAWPKPADLRPAAFYRRRIMACIILSIRKITIDCLMIIHEYYLQNRFQREGV